jgi:hypothetical protein
MRTRPLRRDIVVRDVFRSELARTCGGILKG